MMHSRPHFLLWAILPALLLAWSEHSASGYVLYVSEDNPEAYLRWFEPGMTFVLDSQEPQEITFDVAQGQIEESFQMWSDLDCTGTHTPYLFTYGGVVEGRTVGFDTKDRDNNENMVIWIQSSSEWVHPPAVLALTSLTYDTYTGEVVDTDIEINDALFVFSVDAGPGDIDLRNTMVHEVGHVLGLDHSLDPEATMYKKAPPGETKKRDLSDDDIAGYCALYGPDKFPIPSKGENVVTTSGCTLLLGTTRGVDGLVLIGIGLLLLVLTRARQAIRWRR